MKPRRLQIQIQCADCGERFKIAVALQDYQDWRSGKPATRAFRYLTAGERSLLVANVCGACVLHWYPDWR